MRRSKKRFKINKVLWVLVFLTALTLLSLPRWMAYFYPQPHQELVYKYSQENNIDPNLVFAVIRAESKYQTRAESPEGAKGLMQIMPETGQWIAGQKGVNDFLVASLHDPEVNIQFGCWYLASLKKEFGNNLPLFIAAYNAGSGTVRSWNEGGIWRGDLDEVDRIPYRETRNYVKNVWNNYQAYKSIYK
ncbi:MAG: lytic transglycosylase domain-containing protein [Syntrophomonadaceae bacterium]|jgi:soluble lytic murein transglycosylase|nr:lytic transglycosylase domain-containing protein [Syntrophomonadaceae bacterium]